ncbi:TonB-dependent receptor [Dyadobacter sp. CY312]|uniref:TonB-dependent receptor n=1 Tax=Dyadobacter sp. CY312 TaxID=2907303 RepID=UPI001F2F6CD7|nr:TonB-dependent receptor [Dyadobacter sp. CY312]MCE7042601.1 TonB-dependent receptor [Dyadobacter sp. CY312]
MKKNLLLLLIMRISFTQMMLALLFAGLTYATDAPGQDLLEKPLSLQVRDKPLKAILTAIENQASVRFVYSSKAIRAERLTTVNVQNQPLKAVLESLLRPMEVNYRLAGNQIVLSQQTEPTLPVLQKPESNAIRATSERNLTGLVTDETGTALPGVSIVVKGTSQGTTSGSDGQFSLSVPDDIAVALVFSFVGYLSQEVIPGTKTSLSVILLGDNKALDEVVVVGYGTQKKVDVTGSVSTIRGEALTKAPNPNLANSLTGKMTGVITTQQSGKPGFDDPTFLIRGKSTFGDNGALILVDGIERSFSRLDPNEIESVTVLKDAASASVYGARAANGVVLITTKRGKEGKIKISYTGSIGFQTPTIVPKIMDAYDYATYLNIAKVNLGDNPRFTDEQVEQYKNGTLPSTDWWSEVLKKRAAIQQHNLTLSGGKSEGAKYFISMGVLNQDGLYDLSGFKRYNLRVNIDNQVTRDLRLSLDIGARHENLSQSSIGDGIFSTVIYSKPTERPYTPDNIAAGGLGSNGQGLSPIGLAKNSGYNKTGNDVFQGTLQADYSPNFLKGLSAKLRYSYDRFFSTAKNFSTTYTYYTYDRAIDKYNRFQSGGGTNLSEGTANDMRSTLQTSLTYDRNFGRHGLSALFLIEKIGYNYQNLQASRVNYISPAIDQIFAGPDLNQKNGGSATQTARLGYVGRVNYNFEERYLLQANFRYDGSFNFPSDKRWGLFPAVSAGWRISEEAFLKNQTLISNLKIRASYGQFGNDRVAAYQYLTGFKFGAGSVIGNNYQSGITDLGIPNPNITWETATNTDLGLEFGILNGKISGEIDYFYKRTKDILLPRNASVPETFGATLPFENIGIVDNKGLEVVLRYQNQFRKVKFSAEGNVTYAKSKVIYMDEPADVENRIKRTGQPFDQFFALESAGLFQTQEEIDQAPVQDGNGNKSIKTGDIKYVDFDGNNVIDGKDIHKVGKSDIPQLIFGLNLSLNYHGFDLTANFQGATGFQQFLRYDPFNLESNALTMFKDSWTPENTDARFPRLYAGMKQNNRESSSYWLYNASYVRLRNLEISYTFSNLNIIKKAGINNLRLFASGNNVLTFSKMKDLDPEAPNINPGNNAYYYPQMKTFNLGLNIEF